MLRAALEYAVRWGPVVFPCEVGGKRPLGRLVPHGLKDATGDFEVIEKWWTAEPEANIGLVTGIAFDVLDVDGPEALDALERAGAIGDPDIGGPTVATPRGWHVYVAPTGRGNTVNLGGQKGVDWRGKGGYVVAPLSTKDDGTAWPWITGTPLDLGPDTPIVPAPDWVLALFDRNSPKALSRPSRHAGLTGYGATALEAERGRVACAPVGQRNDQLNLSSFRLGQLVAGGHLEAEEVAEHLLIAAERAGLTRDEASPTIRSGLLAGLQSPREVAS